MPLKWINTGAFAAMIAVNALANLIPIGGNTTGQVSEIWPNLFTPAPVTFAIWGVIYLLLTGFVLYQWELFDGGAVSAGVRERVGLWFAVSCVLNIAWIFSWHFRAVGLSAAFIAALLLTLVILRSRVGAAGGNFWQRMTAKAGVSVYFGWIIAAVIANISVLLTKAGWNGWGLSADFWTAAVLAAGAVIGWFAVRSGGDRLAGAAMMWAYGGILLRHLSPAFLAGKHPAVIIAAVLGEALILIAILLPLPVKLPAGRAF